MSSRLLVLTAPPKVDTMTLRVVNMTSNTSVTLITGCIYPVEDISFNWFSLMVSIYPLIQN